MSTIKKLSFLIGAIILSSHKLHAAERFLKGLTKAYPIARKLSTIVETNKNPFYSSLEMAAPVAKLVMTNYVSKLPSDDPVKLFASEFSGTITSVKEHLDTKSKAYQDAFVASFPGSSYDRSMREAFDELRVLASLKPGLTDKEEYSSAYTKIEEIAYYLGLNDATFPRTDKLF